MPFDRTRPFLSTIKERWALSKSGSTKETFHIVLDLKNSGIEFRVGDSIGIFAQNDPPFIDYFLQALGATGAERIIDPRSNGEMSLHDFLSHKANLARPPLLPLKETPLQELCNQFPPLLPRFYSAASSPLACPEEVHLTVVVTTFTHAGEERFGVASHFLCHLAKQNETQIPIYVQPSPHFTLPSDPESPIIMIGAGTGIAPYRGFMQERLHRDASGKNWLFFGERHQKHDYFYEEFWEGLSSQNKLRLTLAFSRDQPEKIYVQHRLEEHAKDLWRWIEEGAYIYICGDADQMAKQVEASLKTISRREGGLSEDAAKAYFKSLRAQKRYLLDVY
jgi:sulfite reductase (NADPH) flavoprotein alpha-component